MTFPPAPPTDEEDREQQKLQHEVNGLLAEAGEAGRRAARWVREPAGRQSEERHRSVLEQAAEAVEQAAGREIVPDGDGQLGEEFAYGLAAGVVTGSPLTEELPDLSTGGRGALAAVCALAAALPGPVLGDLARELPALTATMEAATEAGRAAATGLVAPEGEQILICRRSRFPGGRLARPRGAARAGGRPARHRPRPCRRS
ncbi:hypothetical protein [Kitasatospora purpeofusca]|uniref:hypothetical protein n=1 Tax=Kitasatospora purpeofusca TaxID=67352 RepID=UPI002A5A5026|nr:hypothetical protein [Kitasatospora purpeofusca]MDY0812989.1 hypothetical protein [Kitasatospora purpeofusca]